MATRVNNNVPEPIQPVLPEYVERECPPPSYEDIMGHQSIGSAKAPSSPQEDYPPLSYIDIMPRFVHAGNMKGKIAPTFDNFSVVIEAANTWLRSNTGFVVWKCETVERKVDYGPKIEIDRMIYHESAFGFNVYVRGLRMWLTKKQDTNEATQQIGLLNVIPERKIITLNHHGNRMNRMVMGPGMFMMSDPYYRHARMTQLITYEGFNETIVKLNETLKSRPLQGTVLNIESYQIKTSEGFTEFEIDPELTSWSDDGNKFKRFTTVLRVFYIIGPPAGESIYMKDFEPHITKVGTTLAPSQFETISSLVGRVAAWIPQQAGIRLVSLQTDSVRYNDFLGNVQVGTDSMDDYDSGGFTRKLVKIVRVYFVTKDPATSSPPGFLSCRTFIPCRMNGGNQFETMAQTMFRIDCWLRVTGLPILNVETSHYLFRSGRPAGVDTEKLNYESSNLSGNQYVTAITVYFPYPYQEPNPAFLPPVNYPTSNGGSASCNIL